MAVDGPNPRTFRYDAHDDHVQSGINGNVDATWTAVFIARYRSNGIPAAGQPTASPYTDAISRTRSNGSDLTAGNPAARPEATCTYAPIYTSNW